MYYILLAIVFPIISGVYLLVRSEMKSRKRLLAVVTAMLCVTAVFEVFQSSMPSFFCLSIRGHNGTYP